MSADFLAGYRQGWQAGINLACYLVARDRDGRRFVSDGMKDPLLRTVFAAWICQLEGLLAQIQGAEPCPAQEDP